MPIFAYFEVIVIDITKNIKKQKKVSILISHKKDQIPYL
jgi:hypothetical protein